MSRISATVSEKTEDELKNISELTNRTFSKTVYEIIQLGLKSYKDSLSIKLPEPKNNPSEFELKNREYLLRILNIGSEILLKLYDEPSKRASKTAELKLKEIKTGIEKLVTDKISKQ